MLINSSLGHTKNNLKLNLCRFMDLFLSALIKVTCEGEVLHERAERPNGNAIFWDQ